VWYRVGSICVPVLCSLLSLAALLWWLDPKAIRDALLAFSWKPLAIIGLFLLAGAALAGPRAHHCAPHGP